MILPSPPNFRVPPPSGDGVGGTGATPQRGRLPLKQELAQPAALPSKTWGAPRGGGGWSIPPQHQGSPGQPCPGPPQHGLCPPQAGCGRPGCGGISWGGYAPPWAPPDFLGGGQVGVALGGHWPTCPSSGSPFNGGGNAQRSLGGAGWGPPLPGGAGLGSPSSRGAGLGLPSRRGACPGGESPPLNEGCRIESPPQAGCAISRPPPPSGMQEWGPPSRMQPRPPTGSGGSPPGTHGRCGAARRGAGSGGTRRRPG